MSNLNLHFSYKKQFSRYLKFLILFLGFSCLPLFSSPLKIVSLSPNLTEIIFILGKGSNLIGRSSVCNYPKEALKIPIVGNMGDPNMEKIIELKPDIVVATAMKDISNSYIMKDLGIKVYILPTDNLKEYFYTVNFLGKILNAKKASEKEIERVKKNVANLQKENKEIPVSKKVKVFWLVWDNPLITVGNQSFINEYITLASGINVMSNVNRSYFYISKESIMCSAPDIIIAPNMSCLKISELKNNIGWKYLPAVKNNRVYGNLDQNLIYIFGPRMFDAIKTIHELVIRGS